MATAPTLSRGPGNRGLLARGRTRVGVEAQDALDRFVASDPGLQRLRRGLRAAIAVGTTILVQLGVATALGVTGQQRILHLLLGALIALNMATVIRQGRRRSMAATAAWAPVGAAVGATLATVAGPAHWVALALFVVVCYVAVWIRRFGGRWFAVGFIVWQAYFFTLYLGPPPSALPGMMLAELVSGVWVGALMLTVLYDEPRARLRRTVTALRARSRSVVSDCLDVLRAPEDPRCVRQLRRQLVRLSEVALLFDGQLGEARALPEGASAHRLRRWIVDMEIGCEELANASVELAAHRDEVPQATLAQVANTLDVLGWGDPDAAGETVRRLRSDPHRRFSPVRRLTNAAQLLLDSVSDWTSGRLREQEQEATFEPVVTLVGGSLPGTAVRTTGAEQTRPGAPTSWSLNSRQALQAAAAAGLAIMAGELISHQRFYWAVIAAFVAFTGTTTSGETVRKSIARTVGTLAGLVVAVWVAQLTATDPMLDLAVVLACIFLAFYLQALSYAAMIFFITLMLGELYGVLDRFSDSLLLVRLAETAAGAAAGILVSLLVLPTSTRSTLVDARRDLLVRLADLVDECAQRLRGRRPGDNLLTDAIRLDEAARQVVRNADSMVRLRAFDPDHLGRRHRVAVLGACASTARSLVPAVVTRRERVAPVVPGACDLVAAEARRLADVPDLREQQPRPEGEPDLSQRVSELLDAADPAPVVLSRRIQRLADSLALLTPRSRGR
ncbi:MAG: FUSC family protein [Marmoricola sp.]